MAKAALGDKAQLVVLWAVAPFALPIVLTFALLLLVGNRFPREIAAGSSLIVCGLAAALAVLILVNLAVARRWPDPQIRKFALVMSAVTSLLGWPIWTVGPAPSVNGMVLGPVQTSLMRLHGLETTHASKSRLLYYWATLAPRDPASAVGAGRYLIPYETYKRWQIEAPQTVRVSHATGLLGAQVVRDYQ